MRRAYLKSRSWNYVRDLNKAYSEKVEHFKAQKVDLDQRSHFEHVANNLLQVLYNAEFEFRYSKVWDRWQSRQDYFSAFLELKQYLDRMERDSDFKFAELNTEEGGVE